MFSLARRECKWKKANSDSLVVRIALLAGLFVPPEFLIELRVNTADWASTKRQQDSTF